jgi:ubiquinone/menaquinone biosynthesis C-methylase UbiE
MNEGKELWTKLHTESRYRPKYPAENVVQYIFRNFERNGKTKVLDLGCGAGRHIVFMGKENIVPYGVDYSSEGIKYTKDILKKEGGQLSEYAENMKVASLTDIPFENDMFDGIICYGALYYLRYEDIKKAVSEMNRVLKKNGKLMLVVRSTDDYRCSSENVLPTDEKNTYIIDEKSTDKCAFSENGMTMHFFSIEELEDLFKEFNDVKIDEITETHNNREFCDSNYVVTAVK